jgi:hypothetical protein
MEIVNRKNAIPTATMDFILRTDRDFFLDKVDWHGTGAS